MVIQYFPLTWNKMLFKSVSQLTNFTLNNTCQQKQFENGNINVLKTFKYGMTAMLQIQSSAQTDYLLLGKTLINESVSVCYEQTLSDYLSTKIRTLRSSERR